MGPRVGLGGWGKSRPPPGKETNRLWSFLKNVQSINVHNDGNLCYMWICVSVESGRVCTSFRSVSYFLYILFVRWAFRDRNDDLT